jgi:hypothetical protein
MLVISRIPLVNCLNIYIESLICIILPCFHRKYYPKVRFLIDGSNAGFVRQLRVTFGENPDYDYKTMSPETDEIIAVNFSVSHKEML